MSMSILLALAMFLTILPSASMAAGTSDVTIVIANHQASGLESEIEAWLTGAGILDKSDVSGLSVSGGTMDETDLEYLAGEFQHLKSIDLSGTALVDNRLSNFCFEDFSSLSDIRLPDTVTEIGIGAFAGCTSLETFVCPQSLDTIESFAFVQCKSLQSVTFPSSMSSIGGFAFSDCTALASVVIPSGITEIGEGTFSYCASLASVTLPSSIERIDTIAFAYCTSLKAITLPAAINAIGSGAFSWCTNLTDVTMLSPNPPAEVEDNAFIYGAEWAVVHVPAGSRTAYRDQSGNIKENFWCGLYIDDPESVPYLSDGTASRVTDSDAIVGFSVDLLGTEYYFAVVDDGAPQPVINTSGAGITAVGYFRESIRLTDLSAGAKDVYIVARYGSRLSNTLKVDIGVYTRPFSVVINDHKAGSLAREIEDYLNSSGYPGAYEKIQSLKVTGGVLNAADQDYLTSGKLKNNRIIKKIDLSETSFEYYAANDNVMKEGLFKGTPYETVILPEGLTAVSNRAFYGCDSLVNVSIPASVTSIGNEAFFNCVSLETVILPERVAHIGNDAFSGCDALKVVTIHSSIPPAVGSNAFLDVAQGALVSVPPGSVTAYKESDDGDKTDELWYGLIVYEKNSAGRQIIKIRQVYKEVPWRTDKAAIGLPDRVDVTLDDGSILSIGTQWDYDSTVYDGSSPGNYLFTGYLKNLPGGITNGLNLNAKAQVWVMPPMSAEISPTAVSFDPGAPKDVSVAIIWNDASKVTKVIYTSTENIDFSVDGNILTIKKEDIQALNYAGDQLMLGIFFDQGAACPLDLYFETGRQPGTDASLKQLIVNNQSVVGFSPDKYNYEEVVSKDISLISLARSIYALPNDQKASVKITPPAALPGSAVVEVTAEDVVTKKTYTIDFSILTYSVVFNKNGGDTGADPGIMYAAAGERLVTLPKEPVRSGYTFIGWNTKADGRGTTFTGDTPVYDNMTVYAQWRARSGDNGGSGNGSGSSGGSVSPDGAVAQDGSAAIISVVPSVIGQNGVATAAITKEQLNSAISLAVAEAAKQGNNSAASVRINVDAPADAVSVQTSIPRTAMGHAADGRLAELVISTPVASITFDKNALKVIADEATADIMITASRVSTETLSEEVRQTVGDRPVFDFSVISGGRVISRFGGNVTVSVPYTPKEGEDTNAIVIYHINAEGKLEIVRNCAYNPSTGTVSFTTDHFSQYFVGYNKVSFKDVQASAWYSNAVSFIAAREITEGTGDGYFSPDAKLTRGQFIVMLMKAYDIAPDADAKDNFADAGAAYYTGYLASAKRLGISAGIGNNMFGPDKEITRQEMFTLLYNTLKTIGRLPGGSAGKSLSSFTDAGSIAPWAKEAMTFLAEAGIISGSNGRLTPSGTTTRAEMAQVLYNLLAE